MTAVSRAILAIGLALIVFSASYSFTFIKPRPYALQETDLENAYLYAGRLIAAGEEEIFMPHPGTPVQYLTALIIRVVGDDIHKTQDVFNAGYLIAGILNALAIALFILLLPRTVSVAPALLAATAIIIFPPFLFHLNYFGADSFILVPTLPAATLIWSGIIGYRRLSMSLLIIAGILLGLGCAIKLTVAPLTLALALSVLPMLWRDIRDKRAPWYAPIVLPCVAVVAFALFTLPSAQYYPQLINYVFHSTESSLSSIFALLNALIFLAREATLFMNLFMLALFAAAAMSVIFVRRFSLIALLHHLWGPGLFYVLLAAVFVHAAHAVVIEPIYIDAGVVLRYLLPGYLLVPFLLLGIFTHATDWQYTHRTECLAVCLSIFAFIPAIVSHGNLRSYSIAWRGEMAQFLEEFIREHVPPSDGRIALWNSGMNNDGSVFPEASFHFFGNSKFGRHHFDKEILAAFPEVTYFNERVTRGHIAGSKKDAPMEGVMGERDGVRPSMFFFPENEVDITGYATVPPAVQEFLSSSILSEHFTHPEVQAFLATLQRQDLGKVLAYLSERYGQSFVVSRVNMLGHRWIMIKP